MPDLQQPIHQFKVLLPLHQVDTTNKIDRVAWSREQKFGYRRHHWLLLLIFFLAKTIHSTSAWGLNNVHTSKRGENFEFWTIFCCRPYPICPCKIGVWEFLIMWHLSFPNVYIECESGSSDPSWKKQALDYWCDKSNGKQESRLCCLNYWYNRFSASPSSLVFMPSPWVQSPYL